MDNEKKDVLNVSADELKQIVAETLGSAMKEQGIGRSEIKHSIYPVELTASEKALPAQEQARIKFNRYIRSIYRKDMDYLRNTKALTEGISSTGYSSSGQYLYNSEFDNEVRRLTEIYGVVRRGATKIKMNSQKLLFPVASGKITGAFATEVSKKTESHPTFLQKTLTRQEYAVLSVISKQLLEDEDVNLLPLMAEYVAEDFSRVEDVCGFIGDGSSVPMTGIAYETGTVPMTLTSTDINDLTGDELIDMTVAISTAAARNAKFYLHRSVLAVIRKLKDKQDNYLYAPLADGASGTIAGYPYELVDAMSAVPSTATAETPYIIFGNLSHLIFGDRMIIQTDMTTEATIGSQNLFEQNLVGFRFEESFDIKVAIPSAFCVLRSAAA